ncbi:hypothetical protein JAAARDRAFT_372191 [Jaapia argillacea MUCL 33604]|uniref:Uncharacterized protein n=1 Tax=Jaapia argillacea MUCL 33604 TaxID=933084 RepID=A0A067QKU5_9AGAM|nr:hypothetical protein JAAARDRAFT_372191 [Jaapia argillacea MUCL 33604]
MFLPIASAHALNDPVCPPKPSHPTYSPRTSGKSTRSRPFLRAQRFQGPPPKKTPQCPCGANRGVELSLPSTSLGCSP